MRKLVAALAFIVSSGVAFAAELSGVLPGEVGNGDAFLYVNGMQKTKSQIGTGVVKLQARYIWGNTKQPSVNTVAGNEHAIVAFTQSDNFPALWGRGVGAFVNENGLNLEMWFKGAHNCTNFTDSYGNKALVWNQLNNRYPTAVNAALPCNQASPAQLSSSPNNSGFITSAPGFQLIKGQKYWIRIKITRQSLVTDYVLLSADLIHEQNGLATIVQQGAIGFYENKIFPLSVPLQATLARTGNSIATAETINFVAFDFGDY